jgi:hypothetical protein
VQDLKKAQSLGLGAAAGVTLVVADVTKTQA